MIAFAVTNYALSESERLMAEEAFPLVRIKSAKFRKKYGGLADVLDVEGLASMALVKAASTYDSERAAFSTYASAHIDKTIHAALTRYFTHRPRGERLPVESLECPQAESLESPGLDGLSERTRHIVMRRFGLDGFCEETVAEIAERLEATPESVTKILQRAYEKLRATS